VRIPAYRQAGSFGGKIVCPPKEDPSLKEKLMIVRQRRILLWRKNLSMIHNFSFI
jgi:hypothetical protein